MKLYIKKYYYKLFDNKKYKKLKQQNAIQKTVEIFENKYRPYLYEIESKIKNNNKITFLHSGVSVVNYSIYNCDQVFAYMTN